MNKIFKIVSNQQVNKIVNKEHNSHNININMQSEMHNFSTMERKYFRSKRTKYKIENSIKSSSNQSMHVSNER